MIHCVFCRSGPTKDYRWIEIQNVNGELVTDNTHNHSKINEDSKVNQACGAHDWNHRECIVLDVISIYRSL